MPEPYSSRTEIRRIISESMVNGTEIRTGRGFTNVYMHRTFRLRHTPGKGRWPRRWFQLDRQTENPSTRSTVPGDIEYYMYYHGYEVEVPSQLIERLDNYAAANT